MAVAYFHHQYAVAPLPQAAGEHLHKSAYASVRTGRIAIANKGDFHLNVTGFCLVGPRSAASAGGLSCFLGGSRQSHRVRLPLTFSQRKGNG